MNWYPTTSSNNRMMIEFVVVTAILFSLASCSPAGRVGSVVYEDLYQIDNEFSHDAFVRQFSRDSSYVQFRLRTGHLLHKRKDKESDFMIDTDISVVTYSDVMGMSDTMRYRYTNNYEELSDELVYGRFSIPMKDTVAYEVRIYISDKFSRKESRYVQFYDRSGMDSRFNSILVNGLPSRFCSCEEGDEVILFPYGWGQGKAEVRTYGIEQGMPPPPFSINTTPRPEATMLETNTVSYNGGISIPCPDADLIEVEQAELNALLQVPVFTSSFPNIDSHAEMIEVLKFITTSNEFKEMWLSDDPRRSLEEFWLECAGSKDRARSLIAQYYGRVEEANLHFTGISKGWKTDRGLIHIVYGPPSHIMRYSEREVWYYGSDNSDNTLKMTFFKDGGYVMDRSLDYRQSWYLTVDSWRNGRTINP